MTTKAALVAVAFALSSGCAARTHAQHVVPASGLTDAPDPDIARFFPPPFALSTPEDAVVRLVGPEMTCSGTVVDEDLVLTALHCVVKRAPGGAFTRELLAPADIRVELGGDYLPWGHANVESIIVPVSAEDGRPCSPTRGADDVAVLVLKGKPVGLSLMPLRFEAPPAVGEKLDPRGFGRCAMSQNGIQRSSDADRRRHSETDGSVDIPVVARISAQTFETSASICPGDSGGPVLAWGSHDVVGVISQSAMDGDDRTKGRSVMVRVDAIRPLFGRARQIADGTPASELPPVTCLR